MSTQESTTVSSAVTATPEEIAYALSVVAEIEAAAAKAANYSYTIIGGTLGYYQVVEAEVPGEDGATYLEEVVLFALKGDETEYRIDSKDDADDLFASWHPGGLICVKTDSEGFVGATCLYRGLFSHVEDPDDDDGENLTDDDGSVWYEIAVHTEGDDTDPDENPVDGETE